MPQAGTGLCALCVRSLPLRLPLFLCPNRPKSLPARPPRRASPLDLNHEKQKTQRLTHLETLRRLSRPPAAPVHHGPRRLFSPPAAQPSRRKGPAPLLHCLARPRCAPLHPCPRTRTLFLLPASAYAYDSLPRSRCPTRLLRQQFLSQPRLLLFAVQLAEKGSPRRRFPPLALPRAPLDCRRTHRPPPHPRRPRLRQAPASFAPPDRQAGCARQASGLLENRN